MSDKHPTFIEVCLPLIMENNPEPGNCIEFQYPLLSEDELNDIRKECLFDE